MSYSALYRKFRPDSFDAVRGQDAIVTTLKNQITSGRVGHAYLFCGTRGTGKTSVAKIMARAVNCEHPVDGNPCNECPTCRAIADGTYMNAIEIDAASNNGVDNVRTIRDEVTYSPTTGRYKVYIIDEVHMLSPSAFNALLKTLEEPPSYVIFILATTDVQKVPATILSRCQRYNFHRISANTIYAQLQDLTSIEKVAAEDRALRYIAKKADGSMRDALSLLDQCISFCFGQELTYDRVLETLGAVDMDVFSVFLRAILRNDVPQVMRQLDSMIMEGRNLTQLVMDFTWYLRDLLLLKASDDCEDILDVSAEALAQLNEEAGMVRQDTLIRYIRILSELSGQLRNTTSKRILLEVALIKLCKPEAETDELSVLERLRQLEKKMENPAVVWTGAGTAPVMPDVYTGGPAAFRAAGTGSAENSGLTENPQPTPEVYEKAAPEDLQKVMQNWRSIISDVPEKRLKTVLAGAVPKFNTEGEDDRLFVVFSDFLGEPYLQSQEKEEELEQIIAAKIGREVKVKFLLQPDEHISGKKLAKIQVDEAMKLIHADIVIED